MFDKHIFSAADILVPAFKPDSEDFAKWAVIACDQFTSDVSYWDETERIIGSSPSTYDYILPEAYLETPREAIKTDSFKTKMSEIGSSVLTPNSPAVCGFIYIERTLSDGKVRCGILGKLDLEEYDYSFDSKSNIRATEQTVAERIPPRSALRAVASVEFPHAMVFTDDKTDLYGKTEVIAKECPVIYDFDLMQGGGHIRGYKIEGSAAEKLQAMIYENEKACPLPYAVGDGNHSLAAAKALYSSVKKSLGEEALCHPARYALCEIVSIYDEAIEFEPIHRIVKNVSPDELISALSDVAIESDGEQKIRVISKDSEKVYSFTNITHDMTVGTLQNFIDEYASTHPGVVCDYIHGEEELRALVDKNSVAFMFDGFDKSQLFSYIKNGPMPRKTFSMGDARSKRYYLEGRVIVK